MSAQKQQIADDERDQESGADQQPHVSRDWRKWAASGVLLCYQQQRPPTCPYLAIGLAVDSIGFPAGASLRHGALPARRTKLVDINLLPLVAVVVGLLRRLCGCIARSLALRPQCDAGTWQGRLFLKAERLLRRGRGSAVLAAGHARRGGHARTGLSLVCFQCDMIFCSAICCWQPQLHVGDGKWSSRTSQPSGLLCGAKNR